MEIILFFQSTERLSWRKKLSGVHRYAREHAWFVQVIERFTSTADIQNAIAHWKPTGCLVDRALNNCIPPDEYFQDIPSVYLDQNPAAPSRMHPALVHDSAAEASLSGGALLDMDLRSYAYLGTGRSLFWDAERLEQFKREASSRGHTVIRLSRQNIRKSIEALPKPCGILAANDQIAVEAFNAAVTGGFSIPDDVAIAGIDNDEMYCESVSPGITSAEPDFEGAGYRLAEMLAEEIDRAKSGLPPKIPPKIEHYGPLRLVGRGSTLPVRGMNPRVVRAMEFIRCNACNRTIDIDAVAEQMKCSRRLATLLFRKETGHTILDEIRSRRFKKICELLSQTALPISTIIDQSGYASESFAKRLFRKNTGTTMREWRKLQNNRN